MEDADLEIRALEVETRQGIRRGMIFQGKNYEYMVKINSRGNPVVELKHFLQQDIISVNDVDSLSDLEKKICVALEEKKFSVDLCLPIKIVDNPFDLLPLYLSTNSFGRPGTSYFGNYYSFQEGSQNGIIMLEYLEPKELKTVSVVENPTALHLATIETLKKGKLPRDARKSFEVEILSSF